MVDYNIFKRMHPHNSLFSTETDDLGSEAMAKNEPPDDQFLALLPPEMHAFDLGAKTWSKASNRAAAHPIYQLCLN